MEIKIRYTVPVETHGLNTSTEQIVVGFVSKYDESYKEVKAYLAIDFESTKMTANNS